MSFSTFFLHPFILLLTHITILVKVVSLESVHPPPSLLKGADTKMKKFLSLLLSFAFVFTLALPASAASVENTEISLPTISAEDIDFIEKVTSIADHWEISDNQLSISLSSEELKNDYGFTEAQCRRLFDEIIGVPVYSSPEYVPMPTLHVEGAAVYFNNGDIHAFLFAAASAGPAAMAAAITAVSTAVGGLAGTTLGSLLALLSVPSLIEICGKTLVAAGTGRGIYIGLQFDYPPIVCDYW